VKHYYPALKPGAILLAVIIFLFSCRRINEATELGGGLIPVVDNITTFDTTINVEAYNDIFTSTNDSLRFGRSEEYWLGKINNGADPLFGGTDARLFLELKPDFYKYYFAAKKDSTDIDSVVLVLDYVETYGDTNALQTVNVYEIDQSSDFKRDSAYLIRKDNFTYTNFLGSRTFAPSILDDSVKAFRDTTKSQLRIRLSDAFGARLLDYDSAAGPDGAYASDSAFRSYFRGFAIQSTTGKAVMGININGANTKLAIYYKFDRAPVMDSATVAYFHFTAASASANYIQRDHTGAQIMTVQGGTAPDNLVFLQNAPGSFATIKIPDLGNVSNRLLHRAELIAEQVIDNPVTDSMFYVPTYLYLDAYDPSISKFRTIPYDLTFGLDGTVNIGTFGMSPQNGTDGAGNKIKIWKFNITRYVQHVLTRTEPLYDLRMFAPFVVNDKFRPPGTTTDLTQVFIINPTIVKGRVRLAGGTPSGNPQRMRLRLIYSKL
jgi:hypothetical protein